MSNEAHPVNAVEGAARLTTAADAPLRQLAETTEDILFAADALGLLTYIGPQVARYGLSAEALIGKPFMQLLHADDVEHLATAFQQSMSSGSATHPRRFRLNVEGAAGHWFEERSTLRQGTDGAPVGVVGVIRDITDQHHAEARSEAMLSAWKLASAILGGFVNLPATGYDDAIRGALARLARHVDATRSSLFLLSEDGTTISNTHEWCATPEDSQIHLLQKVPVGYFGSYFETLTEGEDVNIGCLDDLPGNGSAERDWALAHGFRALLFVSMRKRGTFAGALGFYGRIGEQRDWPSELVTLLHFLSDIFVSLSSTSLRALPPSEFDSPSTSTRTWLRWRATSISSTRW